MSSLTNINNNSRVVNVGRTTPVAPGQQPSEKSIPVVLASDQSAVPVIEQNKVQSEVALSLLGIPRSEVALGIFADVNTYDVNPTEWSSSPQYYNNGDGSEGWGIKHLPNEAGALVEAPRDKKAVLTSKRFFRYQPGRVSAATFGVKASVTDSHFARNPVIRKYGIFDNFDGYYWESKQSGQEDNFSVVRRTQSLLKFPSSVFGLVNEFLRKPTGSSQPDTNLPFTQTDDYRAVGKEGTDLKGKYFVRERQQITEDSITLGMQAFDDLVQGAGTNGAPATNALRTYYNNTLTTSEAREVYKDKCHRDSKFWLDMILMDLEWGGNGHVRINTKNYTTALLNASAGAEVALYTHLKTLIQSNSDYGSTNTNLWNTFEDLLDVPIDFFTDIQNGQSQGTRYAHYCNSNSGITFGDKNPIDTLLDTRKHYYSYFVSSFARGTNVDTKTTYQTYVFQDSSINANFLKGIDSQKISGLVGTVLTADPTAPAYYPYADGDTVTTANGDNQVDPEEAQALNAYYENIKYKCVRDLEYVINGYKNDIVGQGNAETLYNASMYYKSAGLSIYTQTAAGVTQEKAKHTHLRDWIATDFNDGNLATGDMSDAEDALTELSSIIINNFDTETISGVTLGNRGFAGNLVVFRDGLMMTHAAVNDPNLLKDVEQIRAHNYVAPITTAPTRFKITKGNVTFGQKVRVITTTGTPVNENLATANPASGIGITPTAAKYGQIYTVTNVYGPIGNEFTLADQDGNDLYTYVNGTFVTDDIYIETVVPFISDPIYDPDVYRQPAGTRPDGSVQDLNGASSNNPITEADDPFPIGMQWPLRYSSSTQLSDTTAIYIGHVDTTLDPNNIQDISKIRQQYDSLNFEPEYINWIKNNVKPEFWGVYEYRIPRSRFSHDKLDGKTTKRLYSDLATGNTGIVRPGMEVLDDEGIWKDAVSEYEFDFTKVTMLKIEFSWYGAVGALFLAYVPIGNGEARWVRVHHLRASNQLKIASLGNATLPITYNVWGGGSPLTLGDGETKTHTYGQSQSHHIVKYGASYYIDGGDRGTVRLYSHNNNDTVKAHGKQWIINPTLQFTNAGPITIPGTTHSSGGSIGTPTGNMVYFMGAQVKTDNPIDSGIKVVWVDEASNEIYLSKQPLGTGLTLIPDRADLVYGLETKDVIYSTVEGNPVRNRVQVYPTKMSSANIPGNTGTGHPVRLRMKRTPIFQTLTQTSGTLRLNGDYLVAPSNEPLVITESQTYLKNGEEIFGWFQGRIGGVDNETIFGRLYKQTNSYYFEVLQSFNESVTLLDQGYFLADKRFKRSGSNAGEVAPHPFTVNDGETSVLVPLADQLTSVNAVNNIVVPIPNTGANVATLYLQPNGTEQVNLDTYFDYNKEYLSYPLTDEAETLYFAVDADKPASETAEVAIGLTWEEQ